MKETHAEWERRVLEQMVHCLICGRGPNTFCTLQHLPEAKKAVAEEKRKTERSAQIVFAYEAAILQEPK